MKTYNDIEMHPAELEGETMSPMSPYNEPTMSPYERYFETLPRRTQEFGVGRVVESPYFAPIP